MACSNVDGDFAASLLFIDGTDNTLDDPVLRILQPPNASGVFSGRFDGDTADFTGQCTPNGQQTVIVITRTHPDGTSTTYRGRIVRVPARNKTFIRGRFVRTMPNAVGRVAELSVVTGDWETEQPT